MGGKDLSASIVIIHSKMKIPQPLWEERALVIGSTLVVADLHIGYESELRKKGFSVPSQTQGMIDSISRILVETGADRLIINGDLKHNIPKGSWQEYSEIPLAIDTWLKKVEEVHLLKGNHDGEIERYLPSDVIIHDPRGVVIDGIGYFHGHARPCQEVMETGMNVFAHAHPAVSLLDGLARKEKYPCWVRFRYLSGDKQGEGILMPNYNKLLGGVSVNEESYLGPFLKDVEIQEEKIYLLDGTFLGERCDLIPCGK